jgi:CRP-like cAMP-binding protein
MTDHNSTQERPAPEPTRDAEHAAGGAAAEHERRSARERLEEGLDQLEQKFDEFKQDVGRFVMERTDPDVAEHLGNSGREFLLAMRSFIDKEIGHIDKNVKRCREYHDDKQARKDQEKEKAGSAG